MVRAQGIRVINTETKLYLMSVYENGRLIWINNPEEAATFGSPEETQEMAALVTCMLTIQDQVHKLYSSLT